MARATKGKFVMKKFLLSATLIVAAICPAAFAVGYPNPALEGTWVGYNCKDQGAYLENIVTANFTKDSSGHVTHGTVSYRYPGAGNFVCESDLTFVENNANVSTWDDQTKTSGCLDGDVTVTYYHPGSGPGYIRYTWDDPSGGTSSCTGLLFVPAGSPSTPPGPPPMP